MFIVHALLNIYITHGEFCFLIQNNLMTSLLQAIRTFLHHRGHRRCTPTQAALVAAAITPLHRCPYLNSPQAIPTTSSSSSHILEYQMAPTQWVLHHTAVAARCPCKPWWLETWMLEVDVLQAHLLVIHRVSFFWMLSACRMFRCDCNMDCVIIKLC